MKHRPAKVHMSHEALLYSLAQFILDATLESQDEPYPGFLEEVLPSAVEISRQLSLELDVVKKKLNALKDAGIIQTVGFSPKRYRFDRYQYQHLSEDSEYYGLFFGQDTEYALRF